MFRVCYIVNKIIKEIHQRHCLAPIDNNRKTWEIKECEKCWKHSSQTHEAKTKEIHKRDGFGNVIKHLHKEAKLSLSFSPEVRICLRSYIKHSR